MSVKDVPLFSLLRFNPRRSQRGAGAAEVECTWADGEMETLWMSEKDIRKNIREFGEQAGLREALEAYTNAGSDAPGEKGTANEK